MKSRSKSKNMPKLGPNCYASHGKLFFKIFHGINGSWGLKIEMHTFRNVGYNFLYVVRERSGGKKLTRFRRALELPCPGVAGGGAPSCPPAILAFWRVKWRHLVTFEHCKQKCHQHAALRLSCGADLRLYPPPSNTN